LFNKPWWNEFTFSDAPPHAPAMAMMKTENARIVRKRGFNMEFVPDINRSTGYNPMGYASQDAGM
jgi:hypothetical protein